MSTEVAEVADGAWMSTKVADGACKSTMVADEYWRAHGAWKSTALSPGVYAQQALDWDESQSQWWAAPQSRW